MLRLLGVLFLVALVAALLFGACVSACGVAVVSVVAEEGPRFVAPVPLLLPLTALHFAPDHLFDDAMDEDFEKFGVPAISAFGSLLNELEDVDNAVLVRVSAPDAEVLVAKEDDDLVVRVDDAASHGGRVFVRTPLRALTEAAESCEAVGDDAVRCHPREMARALLGFARGSEVEVTDHHNRVDIRVW